MKFRQIDTRDYTKEAIDREAKQLEETCIQMDNYKQAKTKMKLFTCEICNVSCYSEAYFENHLNGKKHKNHIIAKNNESSSVQLQLDNTIGDTIEEMPDKKYCNNCKKHIQKSNWSRHVKTEKHLNNVNNISFECKLCKCNFSTKQVFANHLASTKHIQSKNKSTVDIPDPVLLNEDGDNIQGNTRKSSLFLVSFEGAHIKNRLCAKVFTHYCAVCDERFNDGNIYRSHCRFKAHKILYKAYINSNRVINKQDAFDIIHTFKAVACGIEFGVDGLHPHTHAVLKSRESISYESVKKELKTMVRCDVHDIQGVRSLKTAIRYVTKEDKTSIIQGFNKSYGGILYKAYQYANSNSSLSWAHPIAVTVAASDRKVFEAAVLQNISVNNEHNMREKLKDVQLKQWQHDVIELLKEQRDDRTINWLVDYTGNAGKSFVCSYIRTFHNGITLTSTSQRDISFLYQEQDIVSFDFTRQCDLSTVNFTIMENLKNGVLFSGKYQSTVKEFTSPNVICFSNGLPDRGKLSVDRWNVFEINNNRLVKLSCFNNSDICAQAHLCNNK